MSGSLPPCVSLLPLAPPQILYLTRTALVKYDLAWNQVLWTQPCASSDISTDTCRQTHTQGSTHMQTNTYTHTRTHSCTSVSHFAASVPS